MIIELKDKGLELEFPDDMPLDQIKTAIDKQFYPDRAQGLDTTLDVPGFAAPEVDSAQANQFMLGQLPVAGGMVGGGLGSLLGGPLSGGVPGSAAGMAAGGALQRYLKGEPQDLKASGIEATEGAAGQLLGHGAGKLFFAPLAEGASQAAKWISEEGLPRLGSSAPKWIEELTGMSITGSSLANKYTKQLQAWARDERSSILSSISEEIPLPSDIGQGVGKATINIFKEPKQIYGDFSKMGGEIPVSGKTKQIAMKWKEYVDPHDAELLAKISSGKETITAAEVSEILGGKRLGIKDPGLRNELKEAIGNDMQAVDEATGTFFKITRDAANEAYTELSKQWSTNPRAMAILREYDPSFKLKIGGQSLINSSPFLSTRPEKVVEKMFNTGNPKELLQLKEAMPKELWDGALASWLEQKFLSSKAFNPETRQFNPWPWQSEWAKHQKVIEAVEPEVARRINKFTEMTTEIKDQLTSEVPSFIEQAKRLALPGVAAGMTFHGSVPLWTVPVVDGFAGLMAWRFLGTGGSKSLASLAKQSVKLGSLEGAEYLREEGSE